MNYTSGPGCFCQMLCSNIQKKTQNATKTDHQIALKLLFKHLNIFTIFDQTSLGKTHRSNCFLVSSSLFFWTISLVRDFDSCSLTRSARDCTWSSKRALSSDARWYLTKLKSKNRRSVLYLESTSPYEEILEWWEQLATLCPI